MGVLAPAKGNITMSDILAEPTLGNTKDCPPLSPAEATGFPDNPEQHHDRAWWAIESRRQGTDWASLGEAAAVALTALLQRMNEQFARSFELGVERLAELNKSTRAKA
jgi:hypothetical protein